MTLNFLSLVSTNYYKNLPMFYIFHHTKSIKPYEHSDANILTIQT